MTKELVAYKPYTTRLLQSMDKPAIIDAGPPDAIVVSREDAIKEHDNLLARLHQLRRLLGYSVLMTGKQARRQHE